MFTVETRTIFTLYSRAWKGKRFRGREMTPRCTVHPNGVGLRNLHYSGAAVAERSTNSWPDATLLGRLSAPTRTALLALGRERTFPAKQAIIRQGETGDHVVLLLSGFVKVVVDAADGTETLLAIRVAGDLVGEMAVVDRSPRSASIVAGVHTEARVITHRAFERFLGTYPDAALGTVRMLAERLRWADRRRVEFATRLPARARIGRVLLELVIAYGRRSASGTDLGVPLIQRHLATLAGVGTSTVEAEIREFERLGVLRWGYRRVVVLDMRLLHRMAEMTGEIPY
jgi:CRP/FNR family transcriptional regulator, cyclic AMP receptor protein